jgi:hypothetical protein
MNKLIFIIHIIMHNNMLVVGAIHVILLYYIYDLCCLQFLPSELLQKQLEREGRKRGQPAQSVSPASDNNCIDRNRTKTKHQNTHRVVRRNTSCVKNLDQTLIGAAPHVFFSLGRCLWIFSPKRVTFYFAFCVSC